MKLKIWELALITSLIVSVLCGFMADNDQQQLSDKMIRLHVVANSDSDRDQSLKLEVRDAVLREISVLTKGVSDKKQAENIIEENLAAICDAAEKEILSHGENYEVSAGIKEENFPTRDYDTFSLPAGEYTSLRVIIGEGRGHNWWCVVFPPICNSSAIEEDTAAISLSDEEMSVITRDSAEYVIKFKAMEIIGRLKSWLSSI